MMEDGDVGEEEDEATDEAERSNGSQAPEGQEE